MVLSNMQKKHSDENTPMNVEKGKTLVTGQGTSLTSARLNMLTHDSDLRESSISSLPAILTGLAVLAVFFGSVILWTVYVPLKNAINVPGEVAFKNKRQPVQHLEGGIVKKILVRDGDMVQAGQPLIVLESSQVQPIVNMIEEQNLAEIASMARLEAESKELPAISFPRSLTSRANNSAVSKIISAEEKLFSARRSAFQHQVELLRLQISQIREGSKGSQERLVGKNQEIAFIKEQLSGNQSLFKEGYITKTAVTDFQRLLLEKTGERDILVATIASDTQRLAEFEQRILSLKAERVQGAIMEMKQSALRRIDQEERIRPMRDTLDRQVIRAPVTGKVVGLKVNTVGGVILPRDSLMEIAPTGDNLILEAKVELKDISEVKIGQEGQATISGFDARTTRPLKARVTYISDDRLISNSAQGQQSYYAAYLELDPDSLKGLGNLSLMPGMSAQITLATKPRTPFDFIFAKMSQGLKKAMQTK